LAPLGNRDAVNRALRFQRFFHGVNASQPVHRGVSLQAMAGG
jgi:hypothetical protein